MAFSACKMLLIRTFDGQVQSFISVGTSRDSEMCGVSCSSQACMTSFRAVTFNGFSS